uniref:Uncharacterized protein LOC100375902 n=1 Tax=Saccoglossus kowalevskii TaxID=10224 RepID=A0ABM0GK98_SACKO|nr:PREDICTED: uncharacterized protein LOC100375902 [Saccoglossus kowalevskii]
MTSRPKKDVVTSSPIYEQGNMTSRPKKRRAINLASDGSSRSTVNSLATTTSESMRSSTGECSKKVAPDVSAMGAKSSTIAPRGENIFTRLICSSKSLYVTINSFRGKRYVHIREYYNGYPTKRGVALTMEQYNNFIEILPQINSVIRKQKTNG